MWFSIDEFSVSTCRLAEVYLCFEFSNVLKRNVTWVDFVILGTFHRPVLSKSSHMVLSLLSVLCIGEEGREGRGDRVCEFT